MTTGFYRKYAPVGGMLFVLSVGLWHLPAQSWAQENSELSIATRPPARIYHSMVSLPQSDRVFLFGGAWKHGMGETDLEDVWTYDVRTNVWAEAGGDIADVNIVQAVAYDTESERLITLTPETWAYRFDTDSWEKKEPLQAPDVECGQRLVYDAESDRVIFFGGTPNCGSISGPFLDETWAYDYDTNTWMKMEPEVRPPGRCFHTMVYDAESDRVIVWGGWSDAVDVNVWSYDYNTNTWTELESSTGPPRRFVYQSVAYHPPSDRILMFGGLEPHGRAIIDARLIDETWSYDTNTNTWTLLEPSVHPAKRSHHAMAYHPGTDRIVLFGGELESAYSDVLSDQTWIFDPVTDTWTEGVEEWIPPYSPVARATVTHTRAGLPSSLEAAVALHTPLDGGAQMHLDLSPLGIAEKMSLPHTGDGLYTASRTVTPARNGVFFLPVWREEEQVLCHLKAVVWPGSDEVVCAGGMSTGWTMEPNRRLSVRPAEHADRRCMGFEATGSWRVDWAPETPVDTLGYVALGFAFHPGDATLPESPRFYARVNGVTVDLLGGEGSGGVDMGSHQWQEVEMPLDTPALKGPIISIRFLGNARGTFYLDNLRLVAGSPPPPTAVLEERTGSRPQAFKLAQNYPNPFNSGTAIRFALPTTDDVELIIFNLAGQQVATLVDGVRESGSYTVRWDGRDDDGRELASGAYLYRLRTGDGQLVETRKLLLLR